MPKRINLYPLAIMRCPYCGKQLKLVHRYDLKKSDYQKETGH